MYRVDVSRVRGKMAEKSYTITSLAREIGVSRNTLASHMAEPSHMPYYIMESLASILCDTQNEAADIFFTRDLRSA